MEVGGGPAVTHASSVSSRSGPRTRLTAKPRFTVSSVELAANSISDLLLGVRDGGGDSRCSGQRTIRRIACGGSRRAVPEQALPEVLPLSRIPRAQRGRRYARHEVPPELVGQTDLCPNGDENDCQGLGSGTGAQIPNQPTAMEFQFRLPLSKGAATALRRSRRALRKGQLEVRVTALQQDTVRPVEYVGSFTTYVERIDASNVRFAVGAVGSTLQIVERRAR